jgi:hypothetical protein
MVKKLWIIFFLFLFLAPFSFSVVIEQNPDIIAVTDPNKTDPSELKQNYISILEKLNNIRQEQDSQSKLIQEIPNEKRFVEIENLVLADIQKQHDSDMAILIVIILLHDVIVFTFLMILRAKRRL